MFEKEKLCEKVLPGAIYQSVFHNFLSNIVILKLKSINTMLRTGYDIDKNSIQSNLGFHFQTLKKSNLIVKVHII